MRKSIFFSVLLCTSIFAGDDDCKRVLTIGTFLPNVWTGDITFKAQKNLPLISQDGKSSYITSFNTLKQCQVDKKNIFELNGFFFAWIKDIEKNNGTKLIVNSEEIKKIVNDLPDSTKCEICFNSFTPDEDDDEDDIEKIVIKREDAIPLMCCKTNDSTKIICTNCDKNYKKSTCDKNYKNSTCAFCKQCEWLKIDEFLINGPSFERSLGNFKSYLKNQGEYRFYHLKKNSKELIQVQDEASWQYFYPSENITPVTNFIKTGSTFQQENSKKFLNFKENYERLIFATTVLSSIMLYEWLRPSAPPRKEELL